jgi:flagellar hook assembly protein FlgD
VTTVVFGVPGTGGDPFPVTLSIYGARGELVRTLVDEAMSPGRHSVVWDGRDGTGCRVASGVYFMRLESAGTRATRKMVLLK